MRTLPIKAIRKIRKSKNFKKLKKKYQSIHSDPTGGYMAKGRMDISDSDMLKINKWFKG